MATFTQEQCIERLGKWVKEANEKQHDRNALLIVSSRIIVRSDFFNYADIQQFMYILTRTSCEWWIYPSNENEKGVELRVRLF